jgi:hypothetical protein
VADVDRKYFMIVDPKVPHNTVKQRRWMSNVVAYLTTAFQIPGEPSLMELPMQKCKLGKIVEYS